MTEGGSARGLDRGFPVNLAADGTEHGAVFSQILPFQSCITKFASDHLKFHSPCYGDMRFPVCLMPGAAEGRELCAESEYAVPPA